jgi:hypothetical protein
MVISSRLAALCYTREIKHGEYSPEKMKELYEDGQIDFPTVAEEDIQDRSKADGFVKIILVGQTTWFVAQCIARGVQGLVLSQLELMYFLWWNKPMDVESSVPVYLLQVSKEKPVPLNGEYSSNCKI